MRDRSSIPDTFVAQGALILLPAILLTVFGLYSLQKDRVLAEHQAAVGARRIATEAAVQLAEVGTPDPRPLPVDEITSGLRPADEWAFRLAASTGGVRAAILDREGRMVYPPPPTGPPLPRPLNPEILPDGIRGAWEAWNRLLSTGRLDEVSAMWFRLEAERWPRRFQAVGLWDLANREAREGNDPAALEIWGRLVREFPDITGESGFPIAVGASLRLNRRLDWDLEPARVEDLIHRLCGFAVLHPGPWANLVLDEMFEPDRASVPAGPAEVIREWKQIRDLHAEIRGGLGSLAGKVTEAAGAWLTVEDGSPIWVRLVMVDGVSVLLSWRSLDIESATDRILSTLERPEYLELSVSLSGRHLSGVRFNDAPLASYSSEPGEGAGFGSDLRVEVFLSRADLLYQRQRQRTLWFGALLLASSAAVLGGFFSARNAFRRQRELSEMRSNFVSSVSHEMRAPVASVRLMAEELADTAPAEGEARAEYPRMMAEECRRLTGLIENVLDFSRHEQGRLALTLESFDLNPLIRETAGTLQRFAAVGEVTLDLRLAPTGAPALADRAAVRRILINLIDNAVKHSPEGRPVEIGTERSNGNVRLWVRDHGRGIPEADQQRIFERFYRRGSELRRETQGVGLGLALVRTLVMAQEGTVRVSSGLNRGARFEVALPVGHSGPINSNG